MVNPNSDAGSSQALATGNHYYSDGKYLREKHRLAGDKFIKWALALIPAWSSKTILDAGGGWGRFVWPLFDLLQVNGQRVALTDLSAGMLKTAQEEANHKTNSVEMSVCNIEALPFGDSLFDIAMANHVLYHLQDIPRGVKELARVIKSNGCLLATTNSDKITATIIALHYQALETLGISFTPEPPSPFSMENGGDLLRAQFRKVEQYYFEDENLIYDAVEVRTTYETIGRFRNLMIRPDIAEDTRRAIPQVVEQLARNIIDREGVIRSPTLMGAFVCSDTL